MRKWQNLAPPDDPGSWFDLDVLCPTNRGSYETAPINLSTGSALATGATASAPVQFAYYASGVSGTSGNYAADGSKFWAYQRIGNQWNASSAGLGGSVKGAAVYGNIGLFVRGSDYAGGTAKTTLSVAIGTDGIPPDNLASAPKASCIAVQSSAVILANIEGTNNGWATSDVGDYTTWTPSGSNQAATGTLYQTPGAVLGAVAFQDVTYLFKATSIYRLRYVGGVVKWAVELVWVGPALGALNAVHAGATGMLFQGPSLVINGTAQTPFYWFDGVSPPFCVNPLTQIPISGTSVILYNPTTDIFAVWDPDHLICYYYCPTTQAWGKNTTPLGSSPPASFAPYRGVSSSSGTFAFSNTPTFISAGSDVLTAYSAGGTGSPYVETTKRGAQGKIFSFLRATPVLRRRAGSGSASATLSTFHELEATSAVNTTSATESTFRNRFDFAGSGTADSFARAKVSYTTLDVEIDDVKVDAKECGNA